MYGYYAYGTLSKLSLWIILLYKINRLHIILSLISIIFSHGPGFVKDVTRSYKHTLDFTAKSKLGFYVLFNSQGNIETGLQHYHCTVPCTNNCYFRFKKYHEVFIPKPAKYGTENHKQKNPDCTNICINFHLRYTLDVSNLILQHLMIIKNFKSHFIKIKFY